jgi:hypothetical protein
LEEAAREIERGVRVFDGGKIRLPADMKTICDVTRDLLATSVRRLQSIPPKDSEEDIAELAEAIKHVTAYDSAQIGMLDSTKLWRLVVAARHFVMMLERLEQLEAENFSLAANQCKAGYSGEHGDHMCRINDALRHALIGGNHLANVLIKNLGPDFANKYPPDVDTKGVLHILGATDNYEVWVAWRALMQARAIAEKGAP